MHMVLRKKNILIIVVDGMYPFFCLYAMGLPSWFWSAIREPLLLTKNAFSLHLCRLAYIFLDSIHSVHCE